MTNWKTTASGVIAGIAQLCAMQWPAHKAIFDAISAFALLVLGFVSRDNHGPSVVNVPGQGALPVVPAQK